MRNRFKAVEMGIFAVVSLIFLNSAYNLFTDGKFEEGERRVVAVATPAPPAREAKLAEMRQGDAVSGFVPYETKCQTSGEVFETPATKVRILGPFCGATGRTLATDASGTHTEMGLIDYKIENTTSRYVATVFSDQSAGKFSTDFIPLETGANKVMMEFHYKNGKVFPVELTIIRK